MRNEEVAADRHPEIGNYGRSKIVQQAARDVLSRPANSQPYKDDTWAHKLIAQLCAIGCEGTSEKSLQALRTAIEAAADHAPPRPKRTKRDRNAEVAPRPMNEEDLDAEIADLRAQLGSLPNS